MKKMNKKSCPACKSPMVIVLDKPKLPNERLIIKLHWKCKNCNCHVYKTNILELAEEAIEKKMNE